MSDKGCANCGHKRIMLCPNCEHDFTDQSLLTAKDAEIERLRKALADLVDVNERWNEAVAKVVGKPPGWTDKYLNQARTALKGPQ